MHARELLEFLAKMSVILLSYDQAILVFKLMKTDVSRRNIVAFVDFITGISYLQMGGISL
jgi:hypothetical protein